MVKYGYTIIYVASVEKTLKFYQEAFGLAVRFLHDSKEYGELQTGETILAFASFAMGEKNLDGEYLKTSLNEKPFGVELAFVAEDVDAAFKKAVTAGANPVKEPTRKPWGQVVAYARDKDGTLIELCSPIGG